MSRSFGLAAPLLLEALKDSVQRLGADALNEDLARDCACKAWHLCDHVFVALDDPHSRFPNLKTLKTHVCGVCPDLAYLRDICNESKHGKITRYVAKVKEARRHRGTFSREFSHEFDISRLEIKLDGGQTLLFLDVVDRAVRFWSDFFGTNGMILGASIDEGSTERGSSSTSSSAAGEAGRGRR